MRKPDELALFAALRAQDRLGADVVEQVAADLGIPRKRWAGILSKWADLGWWDYGVSLRSGWFEPGAPMELRA